MGLTKEYTERAIQTDAGVVLSPYADPAVVLAAPPVTHHGRAREAHQSHDNVSELSPPTSDNAYIVPQSPISPIFGSQLSRRLSKRNPARCPPTEILNRRIVSMPENKSEASSVVSDYHGKRIVSMPDRIRPVLEPSVELSQSSSTTAGDLFGSFSGRRERIRVFPAPSDIPQTPSPPSSPESLLIIAAGAQLPEGFLRRKCSPEPLIEEDEVVRIVLDWITWANSPPRPIPALHGPLSLPYARCPSGAEGTIIEEPDNVAQMIWGLGPDDQSHNQVRTDAPSAHTDNFPNAPLHGPSQAPPRLQKKRTLAQQVHKLSRTQISTHSSLAKPNLTGTRPQAHDDRRGSSDVEIHQDVVSGLPWSEVQSISASLDNRLNDTMLPIDNNRILEWQLARLRHALRTSLADMDSNGTTYPGRLEPIVPTSAPSGIPQSYPRIFVESRPNESASCATIQSPIELAQQYRQQQLCRQAIQKQKLQVQSILPTPPDSSSPQWSSHFSPYLTYCSTFSPELVGSPEHPAPVSSQKYRSSADASQYLRRVYDQHERHGVDDLKTSTNISSAKTPQTVPNVHPAASFRQNPSSSNTLAKYIKQLQALSPVAHFSSLQPVSSPTVPLPPLPPTDEVAVGPFQNIRHSLVVPTPPSPESPKNSYHAAHSMRQTRPMQQRLSSVPEEDNAVLERSTSVFLSRLQSLTTTDGSLLSHNRTMGHQTPYLEVPITRKMDLPEFESNLGALPVVFHETSPVKVRLPVNKGHIIREQADGHHEQNKGQQHGHRRKHRYKKLKGSTATNEQSQTQGLVG